MHFTRLYNSIFNFLYFAGVALSILNFTSILNDPTLENDGVVNKLLLVLVTLMLLLYLFLLNLKKSDLVKVFLFFTPIIWAFFFNSSFSYSIAFFYAMGILILTNNIKILKSLIFIKISMLLITFFLSYIGLLPDVILLKSSGDLAHSLGFSHPNSLGAVYLSIILDIVLWYYVSGKKSSMLFCVFLCFLTYVFYQISFSRTAMFLALLAIICLIFKNKLTNIKINKRISVLAFFIVIFLGTFLSYLYDDENELFIWLNEIFSNRLFYANSYFSYYGLSWVPQKIAILYIDDGMVYNENFYTSTILSQGLFFSFIFYFYFVYCFTYKKEISLYFFSLILLSLICSMFEGYGMNVFLNSVLLFRLYQFEQS